jgi:hypothetical protein
MLKIVQSVLRYRGHDTRGCFTSLWLMGNLTSVDNTALASPIGASETVLDEAETTESAQKCTF